MVSFGLVGDLAQNKNNTALQGEPLIRYVSSNTGPNSTYILDSSIYFCVERLTEPSRFRSISVEKPCPFVLSSNSFVLFGK